MKTLKLIFTLCTACTIYAQDGPGGVGTDVNNRFWYNTATLNYVDGNSVQTWTNDGGNNQNAYQNSSNLRPVFKQSSTENQNGYPMLWFDGSNDHLRINDNSDMNISGGPWSERSFFVVIKTSSDVASRQVIYEEGGTIRGLNMYIFGGNLYYGAWNTPNDGPGSNWGYYSVNTPISPNTAYVISFLYQGNDSGTGTISCGLNGATVGTMTNVGLLYNHSGDIAIGSKKGDTHFETSSSGGNGHYYMGYVMEFIMYNEMLESAQTDVIYDYLSAKYDIALNAPDYFTFDDPSAGNFDHDLGGIRRVSAANFVNDAQGSGVVRINNPSDLDDGESLLWAHDNDNFSGQEYSDKPTMVQARLNRTWIVQEIGEVGTIDLSFDLSTLGSITDTDLRLLIDLDNDGVFTDETETGGGVISGAMNQGGGVYKFVGVAGLNNGTLFSLGTINSFQTPLPIELISFSARPEPGVVVLNWKTKSELNNSHFLVQRSTDGKNWMTIGNVSGAGNSSIELDYSYRDLAPLNGISYYRLVQYDFDGKNEASNEVTVAYYPEDELLPYPNPAVETVMLSFSDERSVHVQLYDLDGNLIAAPQAYENGILKIDVSELKAGVYVIKIQEGGLISSKTILIK